MRVPLPCHRERRGVATVGPARLHRCRRGATMLEAAVIMVVFFLLVFGMFDLGLGVFRYHQVSEAARQGARLVVVHGELAGRAGHGMKDWFQDRGDGTGGSYNALATTSSIELIDQLRNGPPGLGWGDPGLLRGLDLAQTTLQIEWLDGDSRLQSRVRVTVSTPFDPVLPFVPASTLSASSTMQMEH